MNNDQSLALTEFAKTKGADLCFVDGQHIDNPFQAALDELKRLRADAEWAEARGYEKGLKECETIAQKHTDMSKVNDNDFNDAYTDIRCLRVH